MESGELLFLSASVELIALYAARSSVLYSSLSCSKASVRVTLFSSAMTVPPLPPPTSKKPWSVAAQPKRFTFSVSERGRKSSFLSSTMLSSASACTTASPSSSCSPASE